MTPPDHSDRASSAIVPAKTMRRGHLLRLGALTGQASSQGWRSEIGDDLDDELWTVGANQLWSPADPAVRSTDATGGDVVVAGQRERAIMHGLSDRLGREAVLAWEGGAELPCVHGVCERPVRVLDGRLGHHVETVVVIGERSVCWGAGSSWARAVDRAIYSPRASGGDDRAELGLIVAELAASGIGVWVVDVGTTTLRAAGVFRCCVHLIGWADAVEASGALLCG